VYVEIEIAVEVAVQAEAVSAGANVGHCGLRRLLHYVAEFAGERQLALAVDHAGSVLRMEPPTSVHARPVTSPISDFSWARVVAVLDYTQEVVDVGAVDVTL